MTTCATNSRPTDPIRPLALELDILCRSRNLHGITALRHDRDGHGPILGRKHFFDPLRQSPARVGQCRTTRSFLPPNASFLARIGRLLALDAATVIALASKFSNEASGFRIRRAHALARRTAAAHQGTSPNSLLPGQASTIQRTAFAASLRAILRETSLRRLKPTDAEDLIDALWTHTITRETSVIDIIQADGSTNPEAALGGRLARLEDENLFRAVPHDHPVDHGMPTASYLAGTPVVDPAIIATLEAQYQELTDGFSAFAKTLVSIKDSIGGTVTTARATVAPGWIR